MRESHWQKEQDPEPDPLVRGIRIRTKMSRIRNLRFNVLLSFASLIDKWKNATRSFRQNFKMVFKSFFVKYFISEKGPRQVQTKQLQYLF